MNIRNWKWNCRFHAAEAFKF